MTHDNLFSYCLNHTFKQTQLYRWRLLSVRVH